MLHKYLKISKNVSFRINERYFWAEWTFAASLKIALSYSIYNETSDKTKFEYFNI